jgi:hypothetical protein
MSFMVGRLEKEMTRLALSVGSLRRNDPVAFGGEADIEPDLWVHC